MTTRRTNVVSLAAPLVLAIGGVLAIAGAGCDTGNEGDRCNPSLTHDECGAGLMCTSRPDCPEAYCCPTNGSSSNPYCQYGCAGGLATLCAAAPGADVCPQPEAGDDGAAGDGGDDGGSSSD